MRYINRNSFQKTNAHDAATVVQCDASADPLQALCCVFDVQPLNQVRIGRYLS
jgi:hypothetical protein